MTRTFIACCALALLAGAVHAHVSLDQGTAPAGSAYKAVFRIGHGCDGTLRGQLPDTAQPLWFKVQQLCERGEWNWADVPASGTSTHGLKSPAVLLEVTPAQKAGRHH